MPRGRAATGQAREDSTRIVLDLIRRRSSVSRTELAGVSGMNKATISLIVASLLRKGIVREVGNGVSAAGRKPVLLSFAADSARVIGVMLNVNSLQIVLTDLEGRIVSERRESLCDTTTEGVLRQLKESIRSGADGTPGAPGVVAIGVGVPGLVDFHRGIVVHTPNMELSAVNLRQQLEMDVGVPVFVDNSANMTAFGERLFGIGKRFQNFVYLSVSTGIGAGIVVNGELQRGATGFAGELGHMVIEPHGLPCHCGGNGCWEMYGSVKALYRQAAEHLAESPREYRPDILHTAVEAADRGEVWAIEALQYVGFYLGVGVSNIVAAYNPEAVLIGNEISVARRWVLPILETVIHTHLPPVLRASVTLLMLKYDANTAVIGAAAAAIQGYLDAAVRERDSGVGRPDRRALRGDNRTEAAATK